MSHNPCAGIIRIRFGGYNLSPKAPLCSSDAKIVQGERKSKLDACFFALETLETLETLRTLKKKAHRLGALLAGGMLGMSLF